MTAIMIFTTCPAESATEIARQLVQQKLAACVNLIAGVQSIYRWHDAVEETKEDLLIIKTTESCYGQLEAAILKLHPYETPEIVALPVVQGSQPYLQWLQNSCAI